MSIIEEKAMKKPIDQAAHERSKKVRDWIGSQRDLKYTAKEAARAIFEKPTQAEINYVSSVLSKHSKGGDAAVLLLGKKHRNGRGGQSEFVYQTITELPEPRFAYFSSGKSRRIGHRSPRKVDFVDDSSIADVFSIAIKGLTPKEASPPASVIERLLEIGIKHDRGGSIIADLLELATELARAKYGEL